MIVIDTWLYGELASYAGEDAQPGFAQLKIELPDGGTMQDLLESPSLTGTCLRCRVNSMILPKNLKIKTG